MSHHHRIPAQSGFTLLELLVAIMILTLIMTTAMGSVRLGSRSFESGASRAVENAEIRALADVLRRQFRQIVQLTWTESGRDYVAFEGTQHYVQFIGPAPDSSAGPGFLVYRLGAESTNDTTRVALRFAPFDPGSEQFLVPDRSSRELLSERLSDVSFDYFGSMDERGRSAWHTAWSPDAGRLPTIIRVHLGTSGQRCPDLLFRVRFGQGS